MMFFLLHLFWNFFKWKKQKKKYKIYFIRYFTHYKGLYGKLLSGSKWDEITNYSSITVENDWVVGMGYH